MGSEGVDWVDLAQDTDKWRAHVNTYWIRVTYNAGTSWTSRGTVSSSRRTLSTWELVVMKCVSSLTNCSMQNDVFWIALHLTALVLQYPVMVSYCTICGPGSSVGIATGYPLDGQGIESRWGAWFSAPVQTCPGAHPATCTMGALSFPGVKSGRGVTLTPHPLLVPWSRKSRAIPLLPLWAVRPVQSLSACTRVHFTFLYNCLLLHVFVWP